MAHLKPRRSKCVFTAIFFGLLLALLALPNLVQGQGANATLLGTITDISGAVVPGASVQVTNAATGVSQTVKTDSQGRYTVVDLIVGSYDVRATAIQRSPANSAQYVDENFSTWGLRPLVGAIVVSSAFIISFVLLFGGLVGPVNLFVFARGKNRFRLFWTTPLISVIASVALIAGILLTDGLGGHGMQLVAIYSLPASNREAVIQEQVSRTAVLFTNQWHSDQDYLITPVSDDAMKNAMASNGSRTYAGNRDLSDSPDTFHISKNDYSGNWFRSRAVSGQYLQAVRPSRSSLTVVNPEALDSGQAPVVLSSFPAELERVYLVDNHDRTWTCSNVDPGHKVTCTAATMSDYNQFWTAACADAGGKLRPLLSQVRDRPGCFYATGTPAPAERLATLREINWQVTQGIYLGPWVTAPATGATP